jgi:quaternary ammonium compound-resistance protein SugE
MAWLLLIFAGLLEVVWAIALKQSDGFTRFWPAATGIVTAAASLALLALSLKSLPVGTAYAVWVGTGAGGVAIAGMILFGEPATFTRFAFLLLIVAGVAGLRLTEA